MSTTVRLSISAKSVVVEYSDGWPSKVYQGIDRFEFISSSARAPALTPGVLYLNPDKVRCVRIEDGAESVTP